MIDRKDYEVGYGRPPNATRFQPGRSGNPRGRPKGSKSIASILQAALNKRVMVSEGGRPRAMATKELVIWRMVNDAVKGDARARKAVLELTAQSESQSVSDIRTVELFAEDRELLREYMPEVAAKLNND